ncbi:MAG: hotdog fold thioesterase [Chloroflexota bacterium]
MTDSNTVAAVARFMSSRDEFAKHLGIELLELKAGYCRVALNLQPYMLNGLGIPHGSVIFSLADFAFAAACNSHGKMAVALSMDIHFLSSPAPTARLECEAVEVKLGRSTGLYRMTVTDLESKLVAELHGMAFRKNESFLEK